MAEPIALRKTKERFAPGDTVMLKSGSEPMVVTGCKGGVARVSWHDDVGNPIDHDYPVEALELAVMEETEVEPKRVK